MIFASSAAVTNIPERITLVFAVMLTIVLAVWSMRRSWRRKESDQISVAEPVDVPLDFHSGVSVDGRYLAASYSGDWLSRVVVHQLGVPSRCTLSWNASGIAVQRPTSRSFFVPWSDVSDVRADRVIAGRAFERDGIAVISVQLGSTAVDIGFRADSTEGHLKVLAMKKKQESGA